MRELTAPLAHGVILLEDPVHRALRAEVLTLVEEGGHNLRGRSVDEARAREGLTNLLALGFVESPGWALRGLLVPGSGLTVPVERGMRHPQRSARRRDADLRRQGGGGHQEFFPLSKLNPSSPATFP